MADIAYTRFYFPATTAAAVSPAFDAGYWTYSEVLYRLLALYKATGTPGAGTTVGTFLVTDKALDKIHVSQELPAGIVFTTGTHVKGQLLVREVASNDAVNELISRVSIVSQDGTVERVVLLSAATRGKTTDFTSAAAHENRYLANNNVCENGYTTIDGDRICLMWGYDAQATGASPNATARVGTNGPDAPEDETSTSTDGYVGWLQFDILCRPKASELNATRFFLGNNAADGSPAVQAGWGTSAQLTYAKMEPVQQDNDAPAAGTLVAWTAGQKAADRMFISPPLVGGPVLNSAVDAFAYFQTKESDLADNCTSVVTGLMVLSQDMTTVRATCLAVGNRGTGGESHTSFRCKSIVSSVALTSNYTLVDGDRLALTVGYTDAAGTTPESQSLWGSTGFPLAENETDIVTGVPWFELRGVVIELLETTLLTQLHRNDLVQSIEEVQEVPGETDVLRAVSVASMVQTEETVGSEIELPGVLDVLDVVLDRVQVPGHIQTPETSLDLIPVEPDLSSFSEPLSAELEELEQEEEEELEEVYHNDPEVTVEDPGPFYTPMPSAPTMDPATVSLAFLPLSESFDMSRYNFKIGLNLFEALSFQERQELQQLASELLLMTIGPVVSMQHISVSLEIVRSVLVKLESVLHLRVVLEETDAV